MNADRESRLQELAYDAALARRAQAALEAADLVGLVPEGSPILPDGEGAPSVLEALIADWRRLRKEAAR